MLLNCSNTLRTFGRESCGFDVAIITSAANNLILCSQVPIVIYHRDSKNFRSGESNNSVYSFFSVFISIEK